MLLRPESGEVGSRKLAEWDRPLKDVVDSLIGVHSHHAGTMVSRLIGGLGYGPKAQYMPAEAGGYRGAGIDHGRQLAGRFAPCIVPIELQTEGVDHLIQ